MVIRVGINGFGRIGRIISRVCLQNCDLQLSAINDPAISVEYISYLIKFDSTHGKLKGNITHTDENIIVDDNKIRVFHEKLPQNVPWHTAGVQYVVEASGIFTNLEKASGHLAHDGVKRVIVTAPSIDVPMIILGVNENKLSVEQKVLSCGSSTLYCLAPIIKVLEDNFGVAEGCLTSIHAMTPSLKPLDGLCLRGKHWRDHRSIHQNIIPATTGACKALGKIIPQVKDKLSGLAFRVPIVNVSVLDLTIRLNSNTTLAEIVKCVDKVSKNSMKNIIKISNEESVSSDFIGESHSCIFDEDSSIQLKPNFFKIICWYENEHSYACRVADSILFSEKQLTHMELPTKILEVPRFLIKLDEMQQTESYMAETSVSFYDYNSISSYLKNNSSPQKENKAPVQQFIQSPISRTSSKTKLDIDNHEKFGTWNGGSVTSNPRRLIRSSFIQNRLEITPPKQIQGIKTQSRLDNVKREFSKMVNITEDLLKKTRSNQTDVRSMSSNEVTNKSDSRFRIKNNYFIADTEKHRKHENIHNCGDTKSASQLLYDSVNEKEVSYYSYEKETPDFTIPDSKVVQNEENLTQSVNIPIPNLQIKEVKSKLCETVSGMSKLQHDNFKNHLAKIINKLIEGLAQNIQNQYIGSKKVDKLEINKEKVEQNVFVVETSLIKDGKNSICDIKASDVFTERLTDSTQNMENKANLFEKYKLNNNNTNVKYIDEELRKRNIILVDNTLVAEKLSDEIIINDLKQDDVEFKINTKDPEVNCEIAMVVSEHAQRSISPGTNTTLSNRFENKQDIYDKLDSASASDSNNSFEVNERKSQIIHITDLTNSFEDLTRLDQICRIIEISDELSDKLFSALDNKNVTDMKKKRWSFRDLCERIHLDEFCNKVFGNFTE